MLSPSQILNQAADYLESRGWCQHSYAKPDGTRCAAGAMSFVVGKAAPFNNPELFESYSTAEQQLREAADCNDIELWNDTPGRTKEEVVAAFREAAELDD